MAMRVLVADDSVVFRRALSEALTAIPDVEVVGTAANGELALSRTLALQPDLMTLDVEMPGMNGIEVLSRLREAGLETGVILVSAVTQRGGELAVRALQTGAFDFLAKPEGGTLVQNIAALRDGLAPMVSAFFRERRRVRPQTVPRPVLPSPPAELPRAETSAAGCAGHPIVLIGVSTGGPTALAALLPALPPRLHAPIFVVQHMPALFTRPLAANLASKCAIPVSEAADGEYAQPGHAYLAPGGRQMKLSPGARGEIVIRITNDPPENNCRPSVDYLFRSAALYFSGRSVAVILTGMGSDGALGLKLLKRGRCFAIAQDQASCVVFGMPKAAIQTGLVDLVAPLDNIALAIAAATEEAQL